jgi:L-alanine-DL-glutamate epimerase-like enolase superfamily enzyme
VQTIEDVPKLAGLVDGVNVKLLKCGGIREAIAMIDAAREHHMHVMLGCMIESSIGVTAAAQLATLADWIDLDGHLYLSDDDHAGLSYDASGNLVLSQTPGLGVIPLEGGSRHG